MKSAFIRIVALSDGKILPDQILNTSEKQTFINTSEFASGMYAYTLYVDGSPIETKKLMILH